MFLKKSVRKNAAVFLTAVLAATTLFGNTVFLKTAKAYYQGMQIRESQLDLTNQVTYQISETETKKADPSTDNITDTAEGWSWYATAYREYAAKTLVLSGLYLDNTGSDEDAIAVPAGTTIVVSRSNHIFNQYCGTNDSKHYAIYGMGDITFKGEGLLRIQTDDSGIGTADGGNLTFSGNARYELNCGARGILARGNLNVSGDENAYLEIFRFARQGILAEGDMSVSGGAVRVYKSHTTSLDDKAAAVYGDTFSLTGGSLKASTDGSYGALCAKNKLTSVGNVYGDTEMSGLKYLSAAHIGRISDADWSGYGVLMGKSGSGEIAKTVELTASTKPYGEFTTSGEIQGTQGNEFNGTDVDVLITNDTFKNALDEDATSWFTNIPAGMTAHVTAEAGSNYANFTFAGTPTESKDETVELVLPGNVMTSGTDIVVNGKKSLYWIIDSNYNLNDVEVDNRLRDSDFTAYEKATTSDGSPSDACDIYYFAVETDDEATSSNADYLGMQEFQDGEPQYIGEDITLKDGSIPSAWKVFLVKSMNDTEDHHMYIYAAAEIGYRVVFFNNDGSGKKTTVITDQNGKLTTPTVTRDGYVFAGWYTEDGTLVTDYTFTENTYLYADWTKKSSGGSSSGSSGDSGSGASVGSSGAGNTSGDWEQDGTKWKFKMTGGGYAQNTWIKTGDKWYHFNEKGEAQTGWIMTDGKWYHLNGKNCAMDTGWYNSTEDGKWYFLNADGSMATGYVTINGKTYYLSPENPDGATYDYDAENGTYTYNGRPVRPLGSMYQNEQTPDGRYADENGIVQ